MGKKKKNIPNRNNQFICFTRPELMHRPLCFHKANPHKHIIYLVLWGHSSAPNDKGHDMPSERVAATAVILQHSIPTEARQHSNRAPVPTVPSTFLVTLVMSLRDTLHSLTGVWDHAIYSGYIFRRIWERWDFPASIWCHHYYHSSQCTRWGATPARDSLSRLYSLNHLHTHFSFQPASRTDTQIILPA